MKWLLAMAMLLIPILVCAQEAPTGAHYAGRPSDTGYGGNFVNATGTFPASVPLELPEARGGLTVPLRVVYGGRGVGALGVGWDIPLSYIQHDRTLAYRRPVYTSDFALPIQRERMYLSLMGQGVELVPDGDTWVARSGTRELAVRQGNNSWLAYDGQGRTYTFVQEIPLRHTGMWLLKSVTVAGGANMDLTYFFHSVPVNGGQGVEVSLGRISYNTHPTAGCAKNEIEMVLQQGSPEPISLSVLGSNIMSRRNVVGAIDVKSRSTCGASFQSLRRYEFQYKPDVDTKLPRLEVVRMRGREGTAERNVLLPIASYSYGSATTNGKLIYRHTQTLSLPAASQSIPFRISGSEIDSSVVTQGGGEEYAMWDTLADITGDGRPDLLYKDNNKLWIARNKPAPQGKTEFSQTPAIVYDSTFNKGALSTHTTAKRRLWWGAANTNSVNTWRQLIDVNGDGRMDIVDAAEKAKQWVIYMNTPGPPTGIKWEKRSVSVAHLAAELTSRGHKLPGGFVPLSRRTTGVSVKAFMCLKREESGFVLFNGTFHANGREFTCVNGRPSHVAPPPPPTCEAGHPDLCRPPVGDEPERTFTEWEIMDLNADGYPDFVFNSAPTGFAFSPYPNTQPVAIGPNGEYIGDVRSRFTLDMTTIIRASFNVIGIRFDEPERYPLTRSISLAQENEDLFSERGVGVWEGVKSEFNPEAPVTSQRQMAGLTDVNGDGLVDYVVSRFENGVLKTRAYLGAYSGSPNFFSTVYIQLGVLAIQENRNKTQECQNSGFFNSELIKGLRDVTGDGIPDQISGSETGTKRVTVGTGAGFVQSSVEVDSQVNFRFSNQREACLGDFSRTNGGLYDVDGDGRPEVVGMVNENGEWLYVISQLVGGTVNGKPEAGRLTMIDNGYGAQTSISYISAKERPESRSQLPYPEIVVNGVDTRGTFHLGGDIAGTRYAYGNGGLVYDAALDRFVFPGYQRFVELNLFGNKPFVGIGVQERSIASGTVTDTWPLTPFSPGLSQKDRWLRTERVGRPRDIFTLNGTPSNDPWLFLGVDKNDATVIGVTHYEYDAKLFALPPKLFNLRECMEMVNPYSFQQSLKNSTGMVDICRAHGFAYRISEDAWYGPRTPPTTNNIQSGFRTLGVDDFGRVTSAEYLNDKLRHEDDICVESTFATPQGTFPRVLTALASRRIISCDHESTYMTEWFEYDRLNSGAVTDGRLTSHTTDRHNTSSTVFLNKVRHFDATYDSAGNLSSFQTQRDGVNRKVSFEYDLFGLLPIRTKVDATGVPSTESLVVFDPQSLAPLLHIDANQTKRGSEFDGFGRLVRSTVEPPNQSRGVTSAVDYQGFAVPDSNGRRIVVKEFQNAVEPSQVTTASGRVSTTFFDEIGRSKRTEISLGSDYGNQTLVVGSRIYDGLGRVVFEADPYHTGQNAETAYGSTYHFWGDGDIDCIIRGHGRQPINRTTDLAAERFPTCFQRSFVGNVDSLDVYDPQALLPQGAHIVKRVVSTAIGRTIEKSTVWNGERLEYATFSHDRFGRTTSITRFQDPANASNPVEWRWQRDSFGRILEMREPETAVKTFSYSNWGEAVETRWVDSGISMAIRSEYDALSRLTQSSEFTNGVADPESTKTFSYDTGLVVSPQVNPTFVLGRMARASSASGTVSLSYDAYGRINARTFTDRAGKHYVEKSRYLDDGSLAALEFNLPDRNYSSEQAQYSYDSAGRQLAINYFDSSGSRELYRAQTTDTFARVRRAIYGGNTTFEAFYNEEGRRLLKAAGIRSPSGNFRVVIPEFDVMGRETRRAEVNNSPLVVKQSRISYGALDEVMTMGTTTGNPQTSSAWRFQYDKLGNVTRLTSLGLPFSASLSYHTAGDRDRICRVAYGTFNVLGPCNVSYDGSGNIVDYPVRNGSRQLSYFLSGAVRTIHQGNLHARFSYDAFGNVQELDVQGGSVEESRRDRRFGFIEQREVVANGAPNSIIVRHIPGPGGTVASRRGPGDEWVFEFGELRGNRFFTDQNGAFIQDVDYFPYGEPSSTGETTISPKYTSYQWNRQDALNAFGLSHLGARLYDPVIGRFLSRDPLLIARGATTTNPYAFSMNDPVNEADPTGLDPEEPDPLPIITPFGGGAGSRPGQCSNGPCGPAAPSPKYPQAPPISLPTTLEPAIAASVSATRVRLGLRRLAGSITSREASRSLRAFIESQIYSYQKERGGKGYCACATKQMLLKYGGVIRMGLGLDAIKTGLKFETSERASQEEQWEKWHFNMTQKKGLGNPEKLTPDAIAQIARNASVGTGLTENLRLVEITPEVARRFLDAGAMIAVSTKTVEHYLTAIYDPFSNQDLFVDPYVSGTGRFVAVPRTSPLSMSHDGYGHAIQYHALVRD